MVVKVAAAVAMLPRRLRDDAASTREGMKESAETFSKDSSRLSPSSVPVPVQSRSRENGVGSPGPPTGAESPSSKESKTAWEEYTVEAAMYPWTRHVLSVMERSVSMGGAGRLPGGV